MSKATNPECCFASFFVLRYLANNVFISGQFGLKDEERRLLLEELEENPFLELQKEFCSYYKIDQCVRNEPAFKFQELSEHKVDVPPGACSDQNKSFKFVYVSVSETLSKIVAEPGLLPEDQSQDGLLRDVKDGSVYKSNAFFQMNPDACTLMFYSDAVELNNPLGAKKGVYKIVNVYWTLAEIPKHLRSRTENWFLALSVKEHDLKLDREAVYKPLIEDLLRLEQGIPCGEGKTLRAGLLCHIGDNLESHTVGGFSACFSSGDICRLCHLQYKDLQTITGIPKAPAWTREEYDSIVKGSSESSFGLNDACVFNVLQAFHAVGQFPMDPLHDFLEKVAACDGYAVLISLSKMGQFSIEEYNSLLGNITLEGYESSDRPLPISKTADRLSGKALSVASHIRWMPFLLSYLIDQDFESDVLDFLFLLSKLNEYMMADKFSYADVEDFKDLLVDYCEKKRICKEQFTAFKKNVSKNHYLEHYSEQILKFGPFICTWTARCESRHRDFVNFAESSKNFINVLKTLGNKNQKKMSSRFYRGFFSEPEIEFPGKKCVPANCGDSALKPFFLWNDILVDKINIKNTLYKVGHLVVTKVESDNVLQVGKILKIVIRNNVVYLLLKGYECARTKFQYFDAYPLNIGLVRYSSVFDYKPLICRTDEECPRFFLHHHLPFVPDR
jgi:hypothetical protein